MCGITGVFNHANAFEQVTTALGILHNRGKDGVGISNFHEVQHKKGYSSLLCRRDNDPVLHHKEINKFYPLPGKCIVGHTLHAVVDHVSQPLKGKGVLVANCEIYNWQKLNIKYKFKAKNDAELLISFLDKFGVNKIEEFD